MGGREKRLRNGDHARLRVPHDRIGSDARRCGDKDDVGVGGATHEMGWNYHREGKSGYYLNSPDTITLTVETTSGASRRCDVSSQHDRRFIGINGPKRGGYGACTA